MIIYDTGALVAAERDRRDLWALHDSSLRSRLEPLVPAGVLAQAWRGGPQPNLSRLLKGCVVTALDEAAARAAGALCKQAGTSDVVDASVVVLAGSVRGVVVTADVDDIRRLADIAHPNLVIHGI